MITSKQIDKIAPIRTTYACRIDFGDRALPERIAQVLDDAGVNAVHSVDVEMTPAGPAWNAYVEATSRSRDDLAVWRNAMFIAARKYRVRIV